MTTKDFKGFRVDETSMAGIYDLCTPTYNKTPYRVDEEREIKFYAVSKDDQPDLSLQNAFGQIYDILDNELQNAEPERNWSIYIRFHLFDKEDSFRKTPRYATLEILANTLEIRQCMFTRNSSESFTYQINDISEFEEAFKANIGWDTDRNNRRIAAQEEAKNN